MVRRFVVFFLALFLATGILASNSIKSAKIVSNKLLLHFSGSINHIKVRHFALKGKKSVRYVFDFKKSHMRSSSFVKSLSHTGVKSFRVSTFDANTARVVIETYEAYTPSHKQIAPRIYQIELPEQTSRPGKPSDLFASLSKNTKKTHKKSSKKNRSKKSSRQPKRRYTIVVDAGHGGKDSGALGGSRRYMEKTAVLQIAKRVRVHLKALGFRVHMTRKNNRFVKLGVRTRYANKKHADAFVSIHANAAPRARAKAAEGIETYFLQVSRSARSKRVAARENSVVLNRKDKISKNVILNLMTGPKIISSNKMAIDVQRGMLRNLRRKFRSVKDNGVRPAPFWVLVGAQMPAVLVETGYITNPKERKRLFNRKYQDLIAKGIAQGISNYFANREKELE